LFLRQLSRGHTLPPGLLVRQSPRVRASVTK